MKTWTYWNCPKAYMFGKACHGQHGYPKTLIGLAAISTEEKSATGLLLSALKIYSRTFLQLTTSAQRVC